MKYVENQPLSDPETAARKLIEIADGVEAGEDGRIYIEKINGPFLFELKGTPAHESGNLREVHGRRRRDVCIVAQICNYREL
jgi:hypothetical protein